VANRAAYVTVARILRPHGRRGEVAAEVLTDFPQRLKKLASVDLYNTQTHTVANGGQPTAIRSCWLSHSRGGQAIFHFEGSNSIDDAKRLVGLEVQIPLTHRMPLPGGSYYVSDLAGCDVIERGGQALGRVREVAFSGEGVAGTPNLVVESPNGEILIPLAQDICIDVDLAGKRITVALPEGLLDLNANS
jgi:16S rRNA processing protein RimM